MQSLKYLKEARLIENMLQIRAYLLAECKIQDKVEHITILGIPSMFYHRASNDMIGISPLQLLEQDKNTGNQCQF